MLLVHHGPRYFEDVPIFALGYSVLLRSVWASEFSPNSFLSEIRRKIIREVLSFWNGCLCCLPNWHASHTPSMSFSLNVRSPMMTPFDCIALSLLRLMSPIHLCHKSMLELAFMLFANMADFISCKSRMNIQPCLHPRVMIRPSFLMKQHQSWSNQTCIPCSTIWPTETKLFVIVGTCKTF